MGCIVPLVATLATTMAAFAGYFNFGRTSAEQAQEATLGFVQNRHVHFVATGAKAQQGFVDGIVNGFSLGFNFFVHDVCTPCSGAACE
jgi:hypothetical protein